MCGLLLDESSPSFLNSIPISFRDVVSVLPFIFFSLFLLYYSYSLKQRISHTFLCSKAKKWKRIIVLTDRPRLSLSLYLYPGWISFFFGFDLLVSRSMVDSIIYVICKSVTIWYESTTSLYLLLMPYVVVVVVVCEKKSKWKHVVSLVNAPRRRRRHVWKKNSKWKTYIFTALYYHQRR